MDDDFFNTIDDSVKSAEKAAASGLKMGVPADLGIMFSLHTPEGRLAASTPIALPPGYGDIAAWETTSLAFHALMTEGKCREASLVTAGIDIDDPANAEQVAAARAEDARYLAQHPLPEKEAASVGIGGRKIERGDSKRAEKNAEINAKVGKTKSPTTITL